MFKVKLRTFCFHMSATCYFDLTMIEEIFALQVNCNQILLLYIINLYISKI